MRIESLADELIADTQLGRTKMVRAHPRDIEPLKIARDGVGAMRLNYQIGWTILFEASSIPEPRRAALFDARDEMIAITSIEELAAQLEAVERIKQLK